MSLERDAKGLRGELLTVAGHLYQRWCDAFALDYVIRKVFCIT
ncbi:hypothetical protein [Dyella sp. 20L07]